MYSYIYRLTAVLKVKTEIIPSQASITASRIIYVKTFKTSVIVFIGR